MCLLEYKKIDASPPRSLGPSPGIKKADNYKDAFFSTKLGASRVRKPVLEDVEILYDPAIAGGLVQALVDLEMVDVVKKMAVATIGAETSFRSQGWEKYGYAGITLPSNSNFPSHGQDINLHPTIVSHARVVGRAIKSAKYYAVGFPEVVTDPLSKRWDVIAVASYLVTSMARVSKRPPASKQEVAALFLYALNRWKNGYVPGSLRPYIDMMESNTGLRLRSMATEYLASNEARDADNSALTIVRATLV
jgi:hypothetical protein